MATVRLAALGQCAIETSTGRLGPDSKIVFAAGLYFILERGKKIPRDALVNLFWPDVGDERHARHRFRQTLLRLKQIGLPIEAENGHLVADRAGIETDFDHLLNPAAGAETTLDAHASYEFLPGYFPAISDDYAAWLDLHRSRVQTSVQRLFAHAMHAAKIRGDWATLEKLSIDCLRVDSLNEEATMARAEATVMRGSKVQALVILDKYMDALGEKTLSIGLPAKLLRSRIAERVNQPKYATLSERHFVGRERDIEQLTKLVDEARQSRGGACVISGEPGIGKSRVLQEVTAVAELKGIRVVMKRCQPSDRDRPLSVFVDIVPSLRALPGALGVSTQSVALLQRLTDHSASPAMMPGDPADGEARIAATRSALFDLFDAIADENTLLFAVEDIHWADPQSLRVLEMLSEWSARRRLVVLLTSRGKDRPWSADKTESDPTLHQRLLRPLESAHAQALIADLATDQSCTIAPEMRDWCVSVADGNPYYLRELLTHWLETSEPFGVPESLSDLISKRVGTLSPSALRLLQICATFGTVCTLDRLDRTEVMRAAQLLDALEELSNAGMVVCDGNNLRVKHDLLAEAARERLSEPASRLIHRRVATVLEKELGDEPMPTLLWECARHWEQAGHCERAITLLDDCGKHLMRIGLAREAVDLYERALSLTPSNFREECALRKGLILSLRLSGRLEKALEAAQDFQSAAQRAGNEFVDPALDLIALELEWRARATFGDDELMRLQELVTAPTPPVLRLNAAFWLLAHASSVARWDLVSPTWDSVDSLVADSAIPAFPRHQLAMVYYADTGNLNEASRYARLLLACARQQEDPVDLMRALRNAAMTLRIAGASDECKHLLIEAVAIGKRYNAAATVVDASHSLSCIAMQEGDLRNAHSWLNEATEWLKECEAPYLRIDVQGTMARLALIHGDVKRARALAALLPDWRTDPNLLRAQQTVSLRALLQVDAREMVDCETLEACELFHSRLSPAGYQDFPTAALARAYQSLGRRHDAARAVSRYFKTQRRDRGPVSPLLTAVANELGVPVVVRRKPVSAPEPT